MRHRDVIVQSVGDSLTAEVKYGALRWRLSGDDPAAPDPVSSFLGALGGCLLMSLRVAASVRKINLGAVSVHVRANEKGHLKEIKVELQVESSAGGEQLQRLVEVAERGCHIRNLIRDEIAFALTLSRTTALASADGNKMGEINLYQYTISPFTEKVRRVLTYKHLKWHPIECHYEDKANLLAVTKGAWTRVPVLEWDGEVVYNSADIIKWLDHKVTANRVIPDDARGLIEIIDNWADNAFFTPILFLTIPDLLEAAGDAKLKANREKLIGMTTAQMRERQAAMKEQLATYLRMIDEQLVGKDFFLGKSFTMADASLYHPLFFLALNPSNFSMVKDFANVSRWYERIRDLA